MRTLQDLNLADDFLFHEVMMDREIVKEFLETVLDIKIRKIVYVENEKTVRGGYQWKSIRLDVYAKDDADTVYDIEMQNGTWAHLPKRSRKYGAQMDYKLLREGEEYDKLKKQIVIFVCTFDLFGKGFYCYTFTNRCHEVPDLELGDDTTKIFLNTKGTKGEISEELKALLGFVEHSTPQKAEELNDDFVKRIAKRITAIKEDEEIRGMYMTFEEHLQHAAALARAEGKAEGKAEGRAEGKTEGARETAEKMLKAGGFTAEQIADFVSLTVEEVKELEQSL